MREFSYLRGENTNLAYMLVPKFCIFFSCWGGLYLTIYVIFSFQALTNATYIGTGVTEFCFKIVPGLLKKVVVDLLKIVVYLLVVNK